MSVDASLLASLEGPDPVTMLAKAVEENPDDFDSWTKLLGNMDTQVTFAIWIIIDRV